MIISILGLLYAILMISVGVNEIYFYSTGKSEFLAIHAQNRVVAT